MGRPAHPSTPRPVMKATSMFESGIRKPGRPRRVVVKELNWLGDVVMSVPALRAVRRAFPDSRLAVLVKRELAGFFEGFEGVDEVLPYAVKPGVAGILDRLRVVSTIRSGRFD